MDDEQWWNNVVVSELGVVEKQQQGSPLSDWLDEDDDTGGEQPISSPPGEALSGTHLTFWYRAVVDGMHRKAGDAQRGRIFQTVAQEGGEQESTRRLGGGLGFSVFAGPGEENGGGEVPVRYESVNARKRRSSPAARARAQKGTHCFHHFCLADSGWFRSWFGIKIGITGHPD